MPKLTEGGKYVFGWLVIDPSGEIPLPEEAIQEYGIAGEQDLILIQGSGSGGGFGVSRKEALKNSALGVILERYRELEESPAGEAVVVEGRSKLYARAHLGGDNRLRLSPEIREAFGVKPGARLLAVRGSGIALALVATGPIFREAQKHSELPLWE
jgi:hypothetical protein